MTGATGAIFGVRLLQGLQGSEVETHLVMSKWAVSTLVHETAYSVEDVQQMANYSYRSQDQGAAISSRSFHTRGMVVCPCSGRTLAAICQGNGEHLGHTAADVILQDPRQLVLAAPA